MRAPICRLQHRLISPPPAAKYNHVPAAVFDFFRKNQKQQPEQHIFLFAGS
jgi:hypothetical protein